MERGKLRKECQINSVYYGSSAIWTSRVPVTTRAEMNSVYTKFLKRYLQIPPWCNNEITHLICGTIPLSNTLFENPTKSLESINLSIPIPGHQLHLIKNKVQKEDSFIPSDVVPQEVKDAFSNVTKLPSNSVYRKKLAKQIFDLDHRSICKTEDFHSKPNISSCICKHCNLSMNWYHQCPP